MVTTQGDGQTLSRYEAEGVEARGVEAGPGAASDVSVTGAWSAPRARDLGVPFQGTPGPLNAITDVAGVEVGQVTLIRGEGKLEQGKGPVRTGVTMIFPTGRDGRMGVAAGRDAINGTGEFTGLALVDEVGQLFGPIGLTGTGNIGVVHDAMIDWAARPGFLSAEERIIRLLPAVGETLDYVLSDVFGHPMKTEDVFAAMDGASSGPVAEGNVGGGTGMMTYRFKGGIGTASRVFSANGKRYMVGSLVQTNYGARKDLRIAGIPVGEEIQDLMPEATDLLTDSTALFESVVMPAKSSLLVVLATDVPLQAHQLKRVARRAVLAVGRGGSTGGNYSGEFVLAFSTTTTTTWNRESTELKEVVNDSDQALMNGVFDATVNAVEEALVNQLVASRTMTGANGVTVHGLPHDRLIALLKKYNRYQAPPGN